MTDYEDLETGQIVWYEFKNNSDICVIEGSHILHHPIVSNSTCRVCYKKYDEIETIRERKFDYIVLLDVLGYFKEESLSWEIVNSVIKSDGIMLVIANNRFGIKYFCGEYDKNTQMPFNGINNYPFQHGRRDYDRQGLIDLLTEKGFVFWKFYYPIPDYRLLQVVYTDDVLPKEDFMERVIFCFEHSEALVADERELYKDIIKNRVFPFFSNSFIIECAKNKENFCDVNYAAVSIDRRKENAFVTSIHKDEKVTKRPIFCDGREAINKLQINMKELQSRGVPILEADYKDEEISMDYIPYPTLANYLRDLCSKKKKNKVIDVFDRLYEFILMSSDTTSAEENAIKELYEEMDWGVILKNTYLELIPMNCFYADGKYIFFDQEFVYSNYPALYPLFRGIRYTYKCISDMNILIPRKELCERYSITELMWNAFEEEEQKMQINIKQREKHKAFYKNIILNKENVYKKALLEDFSYKSKRFSDVFKINGKYVLFGAGKYAESFIGKYGDKCQIKKIIDNETSLWGTEKWGIKIESPKALAEYKYSQYAIIICANNKNFIQIARQLEKLQINDYCQYKI